MVFSCRLAPWAARAANARASREIQPGPQARHARRIRHARAALEAPDNNIAGGPIWSARQRRLNPLGCGRRLRWVSNGAKQAIATAWCVSAIPTLYLLDHRGVIRCKWAGAPEAKVVDEVVAQLLEEAERK